MFFFRFVFQRGHWSTCSGYLSQQGTRAHGQRAWKNYGASKCFDLHYLTCWKNDKTAVILITNSWFQNSCKKVPYLGCWWRSLIWEPDPISTCRLPRSMCRRWKGTTMRDDGSQSAGRAGRAPKRAMRRPGRCIWITPFHPSSLWSFFFVGGWGRGTATRSAKPCSKPGAVLNPVKTVGIQLLKQVTPGWPLLIGHCFLFF